MKYLMVQAYWYFDKITGEYHYRIGGPGEALAQDPYFQVINVHIFHPLFPRLAEIADLLVLHLLPDAELWKLIQIRKQAGRPTIFEIADNILAPGPWVSAEDAYRNPEVRQHIFEYARQCDACQYSTAEVKAVFAHLNPKAFVFENQVNHFSQQARAPEPLRIGWGGSIGHRNDLAWIAETLIRFCKANPSVRFDYMGHPPIYEELFKALGDQGRIIAPGPVSAYYAFLEQLHIGLAPLADTEFNRCRSDVKFIEYAAHGVVPLLANAAPYRVHARHEQNALFFETPEQLGQLLERLNGDRTFLARMGQQAYDYARQNRDRQVHSALRAQAYRSLLTAEPTQDELPELPDCSGLITYMRSAMHAHDGARYADALKTLDKVLQLYPDYQLARLYRGKALVALRQPEDALRQLANAELSPIYSDLHCEVLAQAAKAIDHPAWREFAEMIENPVLRIELLNEGTKQEQAQQILAHQPYHYHALKRMCSNDSVQDKEALKARLAFLET